MDPERYLHHLEMLRDGCFPEMPDLDIPMPGSPAAHPEVVEVSNDDLQEMPEVLQSPAAHPEVVEVSNDDLQEMPEVLQSPAAHPEVVEVSNDDLQEMPEVLQSPAAHPEVVREPPLPAPLSPPPSQVEAQHTPRRTAQKQKTPPTAKRTPQNKVQPGELLAPDTPVRGEQKAAARLSPETPSDKPSHPSKRFKGFKGAAKATKTKAAKEDMSSDQAETCIHIVTWCQGEVCA